jgi:hypothetical protein
MLDTHMLHTMITSEAWALRTIAIRSGCLWRRHDPEKLLDALGGDHIVVSGYFTRRLLDFFDGLDPC